MPHSGTTHCVLGVAIPFGLGDVGNLRSVGSFLDSLNKQNFSYVFRGGVSHLADGRIGDFIPRKTQMTKGRLASLDTCLKVT